MLHYIQKHHCFTSYRPTYDKRSTVTQRTKSQQQTVGTDESPPGKVRRACICSSNISITPSKGGFQHRAAWSPLYSYMGRKRRPLCFLAHLVAFCEQVCYLAHVGLGTLVRQRETVRLHGTFPTECMAF